MTLPYQCQILRSFQSIPTSADRLQKISAASAGKALASLGEDDNMTFSHECFHLQTSETGACPRSKQIKKAWLDMRNILSNDTAIARPQHLSQLLRRLLPTAASAIRMAVGTGIRADSCYRLTAKSLDFGQNSHVQMLGPNDFDNLSKFKVASAFRVDLLISWETWC